MRRPAPRRCGPAPQAGRPASRPGYIAGAATLVEFVFAPPAIALAIGVYLNVQYPALDPKLAALGAYLIFISLNIVGVQVTATLDFSHASGAYLGVFGSGVSHAAYNNGNGSEIDLYGGYRYALDQQSNIDAGLVTYWYPGAEYKAGGQAIKYHTQEVKLGWNHGSFNAYGWLTVSKRWFGYAVDPYSGGISNTRGSSYFEANWNPELAPGLVLNLHVGKQRIRKLGVYNFLDVKAGLTKTWDNWALSAAAIYNDGKVSDGPVPLWIFFDADGTGKKVVGKRLQASLTRSF